MAREVTKSYLTKKSENNILVLKASKNFNEYKQGESQMNYLFTSYLKRFTYKINVFLPKLY